MYYLGQNEVLLGTEFFGSVRNPNYYVIKNLKIQDRKIDFHQLYDSYMTHIINCIYYIIIDIN